MTETGDDVISQVTEKQEEEEKLSFHLTTSVCLVKTEQWRALCVRASDWKK